MSKIFIIAPISTSVSDVISLLNGAMQYFVNVNTSMLNTKQTLFCLYLGSIFQIMIMLMSKAGKGGQILILHIN